MKRGQASAPIELVVAIIIMAMSMALALSVMNQTSTAQCDDQIKSEMRSLSSALLDVSLGSPPTAREVTVQLSSCGSYNVNSIRFVKYSKPSRCAVDCPTATGGCWKIIPLTYDAKLDLYAPIPKAITCIDIPQAVDLQIDSSEGCSDLSKTACPPGVEATEKNDYCKAGAEGVEYLAGSAQDFAQWLTMAKLKGQGNSYLVRVTKSQPTSGTGTESHQVIKVCFKSAKAASKP